MKKTLLFCLFAVALFTLSAAVSRESLPLNES